MTRNGVASVREAARRAGVSPTAAGRALARLTSDGLITQTPTMIAWEHATARGLDPARRALAHNLARDAPHAI